MLKLISCCTCALIFVGLYFRKNRRLHIPIMMAAFIVDVAMVLYIELTRHAIKTSIHPPHPFVTFHVVLSVILMVLYVMQVWTGFMLFRGGAVRPIHKKIAAGFVFFRLANLATSFYVDQFVRL